MNIKYYLRLKFNNTQSELDTAIDTNNYKYVEYIIKKLNIRFNPNTIQLINNKKMYNLLNVYNMIKGQYIYTLIIDKVNNEEWINEYIKDYKIRIDLDKALLLSCYHNNIYIAKILIENGVDINRKTPSSPLYNAVYNGHLEMVKLLIENGAKVDIWIKRASNYTNLFNRVSYQKQQKIKKIIEEEFKVQSLFTYSLRYVKKNKITSLTHLPDDIKEYL